MTTYPLRSENRLAALISGHERRIKALETSMSQARTQARDSEKRLGSLSASKLSALGSLSSPQLEALATLSVTQIQELALITAAEMVTLRELAALTTVAGSAITLAATLAVTLSATFGESIGVTGEIYANGGVQSAAGQPVVLGGHSFANLSFLSSIVEAANPGSSPTATQVKNALEAAGLMF